MSHHNTPANAMRHSELQGILAMIPTLDIQEQALAIWRKGMRKLPNPIINTLDLIETRGHALKRALSSLGPVIDGLSQRGRHSDDVVAYLGKKHIIDLSKEVEGATGVFVALNTTGAKLSTANSKSGWERLLRIPQKEAAASFRKLYHQLGDHLMLIEIIVRDLWTAILSDAFWEEYSGQEGMDSKEVLEGLRLRFDKKAFAVTVSLGPESEQSGEEGRDYADMIYDYLDKPGGGEYFLRQFQDMGSEWVAKMLGDSPTEMRKLEMAHTQLSCGLINALQQSVPRNEGMCRLQDDTDFLRCRLAKWEELTRHQKIIIAIGGHFSHGKSSFLNALMGDDVLPTNKTFTTAIPCRIQHKADAEITLEIPQLEPYQALFERLTDYSLSQKINGVPDASMVEEVTDFLQRCEITRFLNGLRANTASNQAKKLVFTKRETVREQLDLINTLVRLCSRLCDSKPLNLDSPHIWPIITYDIAVLALGNVTANVQFLDLPGFNDEAFSPTGQSALFYSMMKHAAEEATFFIPIVSSLSLRSRTFNDMWTDWTTTFYQKGWKDRIPMVAVTKTRGTSHNQNDFDIVRPMIADQVWNTPKRCNRVLFCDSLIGLGAMQLKRLYDECVDDQNQKTARWSPEYSRNLAENIENPKSPIHYLTTVCDDDRFLQYQRSEWENFLAKVHNLSGLHAFNKFLASKVCDRTPRTRLSAFHRLFPEAIQNLISMHKQAIRDLRMTKDDFDKISSQIDGDTERVQKGLEVWKTTIADIIAKRIKPIRKFEIEFEASVRGEWETVKKELEESLLEASSQNKSIRFSSRTECRHHVDPYLNKLSQSFAAIQAQHVDEVLKIACEGVQGVIRAVDAFTVKAITDDSWQKIVKSSLEGFHNIPNVLVHRLRAKIKGPAADRNYTAATLFENLIHWIPVTDEPFDRSAVPRTQNVNHRYFIASSVTPTPTPPILSQLSEMDLGAPPPEPSTDDDTPDNLQYTTKEWANYEFKDSGFLIVVPDLNEWLNNMPTDDALSTPRYRATDKETSEVEVNIDLLLRMTETNFVNHYIETIMEKTTATSHGWLHKTAEACQEKLEQLMLGRKEDLNRRKREREGDPGTQAIRVVRHWIAIGNLTAAEAAIERLSDAIVQWDQAFDEEKDEGVGCLVTSISFPTASPISP